MTTPTPTLTRRLYTVPKVTPESEFVTKLARNGYYQVFCDGALIGHMYLKPGEGARGWLARKHYHKDVTEHRTRKDALAHLTGRLVKAVAVAQAPR